MPSWDVAAASTVANFGVDRDGNIGFDANLIHDLRQAAGHQYLL